MTLGMRTWAGQRWVDLRLWQRRRGRLGPRGERAAVRHLRQKRMTIIGHSVHVGGGELDVIAVDGDTIVFVEVKTRRSHRAGHPAEAVGPYKRRQLTRLALQFLKQHQLLEYAWRFDIVAITWPDNARRPTIEHFPAAFPPVGVESMFS